MEQRSQELQLEHFQLLERTADDALGRVLVAAGPPEVRCAVALFEDGHAEAAIVQLRSLLPRSKGDSETLDAIFATAATLADEATDESRVLFEDLMSELAPPDDSGDESEAEVRLEPFETSNPWLSRVFQPPAYRAVPAPAVRLLREISPDPDELIVGALRVKHGRFRRGYLVATTKWLRYVQTIPHRRDDFWGYDYKIDLRGSLAFGGVIETATGDLFQARWRKVRRFRDLVSAMQQAIVWEHQNPTREPGAAAATAATTAERGFTEEIEKLGSLKERGLITDEEFAAAKARLLGI